MTCCCEVCGQAVMQMANSLERMANTLETIMMGLETSYTKKIDVYMMEDEK
jgi:hypothetical protein